MIRQYQPPDYAGCLSVFASNVPGFFTAHEQSTYADFLVQLPCPYFVSEVAGLIVGSGGYYLLPETDCAGLVWGMVARDHYGRGIGTALLETRLVALAKHPAIRRVRVRTSPRAAPFFERFGFETKRIVKNHFAPGLHQYEMFLRLSPA